MSWYTIFDEQETLLTSTTTTVLASTDVMLVHSSVDGRKHQTPVSYIGSAPQTFQTLTSSTAVNINGFGATNMTVAITGTYILSAAPGPGYLKTLTSSTTGTITITASGANISSTGAINGTTITMTGAAAQSVASVTLISVGTTPSTRWNTVAYAGASAVFA